MRIAVPRLELVKPTDPGANGHVQYEASGEIGELLLAATCEIVASAAPTAEVGFNLTILDESENLVAMSAALFETSTLTDYFVSFARGNGAPASDGIGDISAAVPDIPILPGWQVQVNPSFADALNWTMQNVMLYFERWHWVEEEELASDPAFAAHRYRAGQFGGHRGG